MAKRYLITVGDKLIGYTEFEHADVPMGVLHGRIIFDGSVSPYHFFKEHCLRYNVQLNTDYPEDDFLDTIIIPQLRVFLPNGEQLDGWGGAVTGMGDEYEIQFGGVSGDLIRSAFPHHFYNYYGDAETDAN